MGVILDKKTNLKKKPHNLYMKQNFERNGDAHQGSELG